MKRTRLLNSSLAQGIRTVGFRRWYQRELLAGHAHLVLLLLAVVGFMACLELMSELRGGERLLNAVYAVACAFIGAWALRRYLYLLLRAEGLANQANCPSCGAYGRLTLSPAAPHHPESTRANSAPSSRGPATRQDPTEDTTEDTTEVCCRACKTVWTIQG